MNKFSKVIVALAIATVGITGLASCAAPATETTAEEKAAVVEYAQDAQSVNLVKLDKGIYVECITFSDYDLYSVSCDWDNAGSKTDKVSKTNDDLVSTVSELGSGKKIQCVQLAGYKTGGIDCNFGVSW